MLSSSRHSREVSVARVERTRGIVPEDEAREPAEDQTKQASIHKPI